MSAGTARPLRDLLREGARRLANPREARLLLAGATGRDPARLMLEPDRPIPPGEAARYEAMLAERLAGRPVSRILGRRLFWGREFEITDDVLDPRPETETLIAAALERPAPDRLADLGTGSGVLAVTLLAQWPAARALATDISPAALDVARRNAARHGVAGRLETQQADWLDGVDETFPLIVANPPYVSAREMHALAPDVRDHDPHLALTPGGDGLDAHRAIAAAAPDRLAPGGALMLEIGPRQGRAVAAMLRRAGLGRIRVLPDLDGRDRVVIGLKPAKTGPQMR